MESFIARNFGVSSTVKEETIFNSSNLIPCLRIKWLENKWDFVQ